METSDNFALAPIVDKIAYGIAKGLVVAVKELENHIANETRKVGDAVGRRLDTLQISLQDVSKFVGEQRSTNIAVQDQLRETDARHAAALASVSQRIDTSVAALQNETKALSQSVSERIDSLCKELGVHQEDIGAVKATLSTVCSRVDAIVERLDRQADAFRSMHTAYSQRETELEQLVDGLARLRAYSTPLPANGL
jgi:chromosome segregation ATPase